MSRWQPAAPTGIRDESLKRAVADYLDQERRAVEAEREALRQHSPYRADQNR